MNIKTYSIIFLPLLLLASSCKKKDDATPKEPVAAYSYTATAWKVDFQSTSLNNPTSVLWDFGDGSQDSGATVSHVYANPGDYPVKITVSNTVGSSVFADTIELKQQIIEISTTYGSMYMYLYNETPKHRDNFLKLAGEGFFNGTTFHRIVPDFVIQGGDPNSKDADTTNDGTGGPGYDIDFSAPPQLKHIYGAVGAASNGSMAPSSGSQFYIVTATAGASFLNGKYTTFGLIIKGMDVAQQIVVQPRNGDDRPYINIPMQITIHEKTRAEVMADYGFSIP
jgi:cyclophilin family peptidyl-prolyl cis-trans isomerase